MSIHVSPIRTYVAVFAGLMVATALTVAAAYVDLGPLNNVVMLGIALVKATLVIMFFMHVKYGSKLITVTVLMTVFWMLVLFALTLQDYLTRGEFGILGK